MLNAAARSVVVLGLAGLVVLLMRQAPAAARHRVWLLGFVGVLLLPILSAALPGWHILPRLDSSRPALGHSEAVAAPLVSLSALPSEHAVRGEEPLIGTNGDRPSAASPATVTAMMPAAQLHPSPAIPPAAQSSPSQDHPQGLPWTAWLLLCWLIGSLLVLGHVFLGHLSLWSLRRHCTRITEGDVFDVLERLRQQVGVARRVELLSHPMRAMPMAWGLWRARLLLPEQAAAWPPGQRRDVLLHELGHVKRWDCLSQLLAQLACALYWFNPLGWIAARRMQIERERACDDMVLNTGAAASSYARHLLQSVSTIPAFRLVGAAVAMARRSTLEERLRAILDAGRNRRDLTARGSLATVLLLLSALVPVAVLKAQETPAQGPPANHGPAALNKDGSLAWPATRPADSDTGRPNSPGPRPGGRSGFGAAAALVPPTLGTGPTCTFDATIYDVRMPADQIGRLDVDALTQASGNAEAFEKALAALGTAQPLYRASQSIRLSGDNILIGTEMPFITSARLGEKGQAINSVSYQSIGAAFSLAGDAGATGTIDLDLNIQLSSISEGATAIAANVKAPVFRRATISHKGPVQPRKPFVVVSIDAGSGDGNGKAVAFIGRITMGEPQSTTRASGGK